MSAREAPAAVAPDAPIAASFVRSLKAVGWSFFGVRKAKDLERDAAGIRPLHLVVAALLAAALFIGGLLVVVTWAVDRADGPRPPAAAGRS